MADPVARAKRFSAASTICFIAYCVLIDGNLLGLVSEPAGRVSRHVSTLAGIAAWTLMCVAYGMQRSASAKPAP